MRMPDGLTKRVARWGYRWIARNYPDFICDQEITNNSGVVVINRYNVFDLGPLHIRLHRIIRSDFDRDLHTHPWCNATWVLDGLYYELIPGHKTQDTDYQIGEPYHTSVKVRRTGDLVARGPSWAHRLLLPPVTGSHSDVVFDECLTLFVHWNWGKGKRWGFWNDLDGSYRLAKENS